MNRFEEWIQEIERATNQRMLNSGIKPSWLASNIVVFDIRKYKFVQVGPNPRFAVALDGTIYGVKNNDVNKKECYGNVDTFEEFDWEPYWPVKRSLYDWTKDEKKKSDDKPRTKAREAHSG